MAKLFFYYSAIEGFLRRRNGTDLRDVEREIVAHALVGLPATLLRSETMDWWTRLPGVVSQWNGNGNGQPGRVPVRA